jgi:glycosyltransferase involved in cell wall biosynthesis
VRRTDSRRIGLYSDGETVGGAERAILNLVSAYRGDAELVVVTTSSEFIDAVTADSSQVETHLLSPRRSAAAAIRDHRAALRSLDLDLLQVTRNNPFAARPAVLAGLSLRMPTIAVEQLVLPARRRRGRLMTRVMAAPLAGHVAVGKASADDLRDQFGIPRGSITVIHNGVPDDDELEPMSFPTRPVVGCAARFEDQKQIDQLLRAAARLPAVQIVLVGDGTRRVALEQLATSLGLDERLTIIGWKPDARPAIAGFDVFVLPSRDEAFPLTIIEAMLSSTPVVATDVGSVREAVIDGETGLLVRPGDVGALAAAIGRVLDEPGLGARLAANARAKAASEFTSEAMACAYDRLWSDVLARRSTSLWRRRHAGSPAERARCGS